MLRVRREKKSFANKDVGMMLRVRRRVEETRMQSSAKSKKKREKS